MKDSAVRVYRTMIAMCVIACFSLIIHFVIFLTVRRAEVFAGPGPESEVMWRYWGSLLNQLEYISILFLTDLGIFVRARSTAKEILDNIETDGECSGNIYWLSVIVGGFNVYSLFRLFIRFISVFSTLLGKGYVGEAIGMMVTIIVPLVLITWWTVWVVLALRRKLHGKAADM